MFLVFFFFKQMTAYEMRISDWSSDVCSSDLHYLLPFVIAGVIILHIWALHIPGSSNPTGVDVKGAQDTVPFHPYYTAKDGVGVGVFLLVFAVILFFAPNYLGHSDNYIPANPLSTPALIVPEWY